MDPHQANLQPNFHLLGSRLRFNPTFLVVAFDYTLSFSKHVSSLKAKFFPRLKALRCISASSWIPSKESLSVLYKSFLRPLLTYASPGWFSFLCVTNITKLERLHRAASCTITGCLSSSLSHFFSPRLLHLFYKSPWLISLFFSYGRALCLPTSFPISGLARLGVKPRLCRLSWRAFASTYPLMLSSACPREALLACPPWNPPSFTVESIFSSPCSRSDPPLSYQGATLAHLDSLLPHDLVLCSFSFWQGRLRRSSNCFLCGTRATLVSFSASPVCLTFSVETCAILYNLGWSRQHQQLFHFSSLLQSDSRSVLSSIFPLILNSVADLAGTVFSLLLFYHATMGPWKLVSPGERRGWWAAQAGSAACAFRNPL